MAPSLASSQTHAARLQLDLEMPAILEAVGYSEMWGVELEKAGLEHVPYRIVLEKFLRANGHDVARAAEQIRCALDWRKRHRPRAGLGLVYRTDKFRDVGVVLACEGPVGLRPPRTVVTWNMYGKAEDPRAAFEDVTDFIYWRAALMEKGIDMLGLREATEMIPHQQGDDPYRMIQVHDCLNVSRGWAGFGMPSITGVLDQQWKIFSVQYPELMSHTYIVNVPTLVRSKASKFMDKAGNGAKLTVLGHGRDLARHLAAKVKAEDLPPAYGGCQGDLEINWALARKQEPHEPSASDGRNSPAPDSTRAQRGGSTDGAAQAGARRGTPGPLSSHPITPAPTVRGCVAPPNANAGTSAPHPPKGPQPAAAEKDGTQQEPPRAGYIGPLPLDLIDLNISDLDPGKPRHSCSDSAPAGGTGGGGEVLGAAPDGQRARAQTIAGGERPDPAELLRPRPDIGELP